jgi:hypothetical protein
MFEVSAGEGMHQVTLKMWHTGEGWIGSLTGGEKPHVGGVLLAVPRPSLKGSGMSCDIWSIPVPAHLDNEAALPLVKQICTKIGEVVSLTSGIHINNASAEDIAIIRRNCQTALDKLWERMEKES